MPYYNSSGVLIFSKKEKGYIKKGRKIAKAEKKIKRHKKRNFWGF